MIKMILINFIEFKMCCVGEIGKNRGVVCFESKEEMERAADELDGREINGREARDIFQVKIKLLIINSGEIVDQNSRGMGLWPRQITQSFPRPPLSVSQPKPLATSKTISIWLTTTIRLKRKTIKVQQI